MRRLLPFLLAMACGGPSAEKAIETPIAKDQRHPTEAPPASTSDQQRHAVQSSFDDMQTTQDAYHEAAQAESGSGSAAKNYPPYPPRFPKKEPPKKTGPAVEAPKQ